MEALLDNVVLDTWNQPRSDEQIHNLLSRRLSIVDAAQDDELDF